MSTLYEELKDYLEQKKGVALATIVRGPEHVGAKLLVLPQQAPHGTLGNPKLDQQVGRDAAAAIWSGDARTRTYTIETTSGPQTFDVFIEGFPPPPTLIIIGAGHISIPLTTF